MDKDSKSVNDNKNNVKTSDIDDIQNEEINDQNQNINRDDSENINQNKDNIPNDAQVTQDIGSDIGNVDNNVNEFSPQNESENVNNYPNNDQNMNQFDNQDQNQQFDPNQDQFNEFNQDPNFIPENDPNYDPNQDPNYDPSQDQYDEYYQNPNFIPENDPNYDPNQDPNYDSDQLDDEESKNFSELSKQNISNQKKLFSLNRRGIFERANDYLDDSHDLMEDAAVSDRERSDKIAKENSDFMKFYNNITGSAEVGNGDVHFLDDYLLDDEFVIQSFKFYRDSIILTNLGIYKVDIKFLNSNNLNIIFYPKETIKTISFERTKKNFQAIIRIGVECNPDWQTKLPNKPLEFRVQHDHVESAKDIVKLVKQYYLCGY